MFNSLSVRDALDHCGSLYVAILIASSRSVLSRRVALADD